MVSKVLTIYIYTYTA